LWGVYRFKVGFGGETTNLLGCLDLPLKEVCAAAWYRFESAYHQLY
jgi:lipid II:glycine glycyltransferase (peptidoglycan interpeptide bridge formation enzyme)